MTSNYILIYRLAELMLEHEQHILPVDLLFDDEQIGDFVKSIQIDSPYQQLLLDGVLSESVRDEQLYVSFTVEGYFHYVLGEVIYDRTVGLGAEAIMQIVEKNKLKGAKEGVEQCLIFDVFKGDISRLLWLIDNLENNLNLFTLPLATAFDVENKMNRPVFAQDDLISKILHTSTDNDLQVIDNVFKFMVQTQRHQSYKQLSLQIFNFDLGQSIKSIQIKLRAIQYLDIDKRNVQLKKLFGLLKKIKNEKNKVEVNLYFGMEYRKISNFNEALSCLLLAIDNLPSEISLLHIKCHDAIGLIYGDLGNYSLALNHHYTALRITENIFGKNHLLKSRAHNYIGSILHISDYNAIEDAIEHLTIALNLAKSILGTKHTETAIIFNNIGIAFAKKADFNNAELNYINALGIFQSILPKNDPWISTIFNNLASLYSKTGELEKALSYQKNALLININNNGEQDITTAIMQSTYAKILFSNNQNNDAIEHFIKTINTFKKLLPSNHIYIEKAHSNLGVVYMTIGLYESAIKCFKSSIKVLDLHGEKFLNKKIELILWLVDCYEKIGDFKHVALYKKMYTLLMKKNDDL